MSEVTMLTLNGVDYELVDQTSRNNASSALTTAQSALSKAEEALKTPSISYNSSKKSIIITTSEV